MAEKFEGERVGVVIRRAHDDQLVANLHRHLIAAHPELVGEVSRDGGLGTAREA